MASRKRKNRARTNWGLLLGLGGVALVLLIGVGVGIVWLVRSGNQQAQQGQPPGPPAPSEYDEWVTYQPSIQKREAWVRIKKVLIVDKMYRKLDRLQQQLPPAWRANSPADADAIVLTSWDTVKGMGNAKGDGKFITFTPIDLHRASVVVISPRKEFYGEVLLNPVGKATTTTAANVIEYLEQLNAEVGGPNDPTRGQK